MKVANDFFDEIVRYQTGKFAKYGSTPRGVDWNGIESQTIRFEQLCKLICAEDSGFSVNDLGCGYAALFDYLQRNFTISRYLGVDMVSEMIRDASQRHAATPSARFIIATAPDHVADYGMASGIFSLRLNKTDAEWWNYLKDTLDILNETSVRGFAFNCLTSYSDEDKKQDYLYYADPCKIFDLCKHRYSRHVALLHDYGVYDFTILVKKLL